MGNLCKTDAYGLGEHVSHQHQSTLRERERVNDEPGEESGPSIEVLEFSDYETTKYAILSHRWIDSTEVEFEKRGCSRNDEGQGQRWNLWAPSLLDSCGKLRGVDTNGHGLTPVIDKRSSAELSEAINPFLLDATSRDTTILACGP